MPVRNSDKPPLDEQPVFPSGTKVRFKPSVQLETTSIPDSQGDCLVRGVGLYEVWVPADRLEPADEPPSGFDDWFAARRGFESPENVHSLRDAFQAGRDSAVSASDGVALEKEFERGRRAGLKEAAEVDEVERQIRSRKATNQPRRSDLEIVKDGAWLVRVTPEGRIEYPFPSRRESDAPLKLDALRFALDTLPAADRLFMLESGLKALAAEGKEKTDA